MRLLQARLLQIELLHGPLSYSPSVPPVSSSLSPFFSGWEGVFCNAFEWKELKERELLLLICHCR